ncbi:MAG: 30S ribosomal protein S18 [Pseudomonadales bacterium]|jgi:small subunit ribosomal protein S18|nr:30S ribosomal protein S18 [Pseudomonadales bacterium]
MKRQKKERIQKLNIDKRLVFSYKEPEVLKTCLNEQGMIVSRTRTGLPQKKQRQLAIEVKRARHLALLPFVPGV